MSSTVHACVPAPFVAPSTAAPLSDAEGLAEARARKGAADALYRAADLRGALAHYEQAAATLEMLAMLGGGGGAEDKVPELLATCLLNCALCFKRLDDPGGAARKAGLALGCGGLAASPLREAKALFTRAAARQALAAAGGAARAEGRQGAQGGAALGAGWARGAGVLGADADDEADEHELDEGALLHAAAADLERAEAQLERVEAEGAVRAAPAPAPAAAPAVVELPTSGFVDLRSGSSSAAATAAAPAAAPAAAAPPPPPPSAAAVVDTATARKMLREVRRARKAVRSALRTLRGSREAALRERMGANLAGALADSPAADREQPAAAAAAPEASAPPAPARAPKQPAAPEASKMSVDYSRFDRIGDDDEEGAEDAEAARLLAAQRRVVQVERSVHESIATNKMGEAEEALRGLAQAEGAAQAEKLKSAKAALALAMQAGLGQSDDAVAEVKAAMDALQRQMDSGDLV